MYGLRVSLSRKAATPGTHVEGLGTGNNNGERRTANGVPDKSVGRTTANGQLREWSGEAVRRER
jgi:hypothetical protein